MNGCVVDFRGGPLDGHRQYVDLTPDQLNDVAMLPVGPILALLNGDPAYERIRRLAVYELVSGRSYRHVGSIGAQVVLELSRCRKSARTKSRRS